jgi:hypothetical protein
MQARLDLHDTASSPSLADLGTAWIVHRRPSHRSISARPARSPTATQALLDVHDTPSRPESAVLGMAWIDQPVPSRPCATGCGPTTGSSKVPTAIHVVSVGHDTASNPPAPVAPLWAVHLKPSQRKVGAPTAVHAFPDVHDTSLSSPAKPSGSFWTDQPDASAIAASAAKAPDNHECRATQDSASRPQHSRLSPSAFAVHESNTESCGQRRASASSTAGPT